MALTGLRIDDAPEAWRAVGFAIGTDGAFITGGVTLRLHDDDGAGVIAWELAGVPTGAELDGLCTLPAGRSAPEERHPNGVVALDHVVVSTPDLPRTTRAFSEVGLEARRIRDAGPMRQAFYVLGPAVAELVGPARAEGSASGPARVWGLTFVVEDLDATARGLGGRLGPLRDAVQSGRRIATVSRAAGLAVPVALISPRG